MKFNLGISSRKYISIAFLLSTIVIALILSGLPIFHSFLMNDQILENLTRNTPQNKMRQMRQSDMKKAEAILKDAVRAKQDKLKNKDIMKAERLLRENSSNSATIPSMVSSRAVEPKMRSMDRPKIEPGMQDRMRREQFDTFDSTKTMPLHISPRYEIVQDIMRQQMNAAAPIPLERQVNKATSATKVSDQVFGLMQPDEIFTF